LVTAAASIADVKDASAYLLCSYSDTKSILNYMCIVLNVVLKIIALVTR